MAKTVCVWYVCALIQLAAPANSEIIDRIVAVVDKHDTALPFAEIGPQRRYEHQSQRE